MELSKLQVIESIPKAEEYLRLRKALGWELYSKKEVSKALQNSLYCVTIYYDNLVCGMGRVVGDTCLCFYIQDIMVMPQVQRQGIGTIIMEHIMTYLNKTSIRGAYIGLMSKIDKELFYERFGFVRRPNETMGAGMVIPYFDPGENRNY